jgi:hypothetical protein
MIDKPLWRHKHTVIGRYDHGLYVATVKVAKTGKQAGEEVLSQKSYFGNGPRNVKQAVLEAAGRIADVQTCETLREYADRLEMAVCALNGTLPARSANA